MQQTDTSNVKIKNTQTEGGAQTELQALMSKLYCVARQCSDMGCSAITGL